MISALLSQGTAEVLKLHTEANVQKGDQWQKQPCQKVDLCFKGETLHKVDFSGQPDVFRKLAPGAEVKVALRASVANFDGRVSMRYELVAAQIVDPATGKVAA